MSGKHIPREKLTIKKMIGLYQAKYLQAPAESGYYEALFVYVQKRLNKCVFGEERPTYKQYPVHCYQPAEREEVKQIIRRVGSRMLWRRPILTMRHLIDDKCLVSELPEKYRLKKTCEQYARQVDLSGNLQLDRCRSTDSKPLHP